MFSKCLFTALTLISCSEVVYGLCSSTQYLDQTSSPYVLPYPVGKSYNVRQGNCNNLNTHNSRYNATFAYDFEMPIGSAVIASRSGKVFSVVDNFLDTQNNAGEANLIIIIHSDGTFASYGHLTYLGSLVKRGQNVKRGEIIGYSGNSGVSKAPHLHFDVLQCPFGVSPSHPDCYTLPITFRNTRSHPYGLVGDPYSRVGRGDHYMAEPYNSTEFNF